ncbi:MAG: iron-containing alcohol dehydrogenase [Candidatus Methylomirabilales bacterium]
MTTAKELKFSFSVPTTVVFGLGVLDTIATHAKSLGFTRPLVVTDKILSQGEGVARLRAKLSEAGLTPSVWDGIAAEPTDATISAGAKHYRAANCDGLIGLGGGSAMDTAKGIGVLAISGDDDPTPYQRFGTKTPTGCVPVLAIPTTAGTGAEVTSVSVFTSERTGHKLPIRHPSLLPRIALVDPRLMLSMPPKVTMATGVDALSHAVECFTQVREHPFSDTLALEATRLIVENLPKAVQNGQDEEARTRMALAATMAGTAFEVGGLQFHAYAQALGAKYHAAHGITCGIALRAGLAQILPTATAKLARMAPAFGVDVRGLSPAQAAEKGVRAAIAFIDGMGIPKVTEAMPAVKADVPMLLKETLETTGVPISPETAQQVWDRIFA